MGNCSGMLLVMKEGFLTFLGTFSCCFSFVLLLLFAFCFSFFRSPDSSFLCSASDDRTMILWDLESQKAVSTFFFFFFFSSFSQLERTFALCFLCFVQSFW